MSLQSILISLLLVSLSGMPRQNVKEPQPQTESQTNVGLRAGIAYIEHGKGVKPYENFGLTHCYNDLSTEVTYHREIEPRQREDELTILGLSIEGERFSRRYLVGVNFGYDLKRLKLKRSYLRLTPSINVLGGFDLNISEIEMGENEDKEMLPRDIDIAFFAGIGMRVGVVYPLSHLTKLPLLRNFEIGLGLAAEYRRNDLSEDELSKKNGYGLESFVSLGYAPGKE